MRGTEIASAGHRPGVPPNLDVLLDRAAEGDRLAFAQFYDATSTSAYRLALTVHGDTETAENAVLRAYTDAWRRSPARADSVSAHCWLLGLVHGNALAAQAASRSGEAGHGPRGRLRTSHDAGASTRPSRRPPWRTRGLAEPG